MVRRTDWPRTVDPERRIVRYQPLAVGPVNSYVSPTPDDPPPPDPNDPFTPPVRANTVVNAPPGTTVQTDTYYENPQGSLIFPDSTSHVTVVGLKSMPWIAGFVDVHLQGTPTNPINTGPRHDGGDGTQVKRGANAGQETNGLTIRYWHCHDIDRRDNPSGHSDGIQIMSGKNITLVDCMMTNVGVQPYFVRDVGGWLASNGGAGGGPCENITFLRCGSDSQGAEGYYAFRIAGDDEVGDTGRFVPKNVKIIDCYGDRGVAMDTAAANNGGEIINYTFI